MKYLCILGTMTLDILEESDCLSDGQFLSSPPPGEEIVISGISGNFPASKDLSEFYDNLINKRDLFSDNLHTVNSECFINHIHKLVAVICLQEISIIFSQVLKGHSELN